MQPPEEGGDVGTGEHVSDHGAVVGPGFNAFCEEGVGGGAGKEPPQ